jgi:hypothetical protein
MAVKRKVSDALDDKVMPASGLFHAGSVLTGPSALDQGGSALRAQPGPVAPSRALREEGFEHVRVTAETPVVSVVEAW